MIEMHGVDLVYPKGIHALTDINLFVDRGEFVFLIGTTGSGKSSLLRLIYREIIPTHGVVVVDNEDVTVMKKDKVPYLRRKLGVVFQDFKLLPAKTVHENVAFALEVTSAPFREIPRKVEKALSLVNFVEKARRFPGELSGGEQQRVSIARALVNQPIILLADEPTGNLDPDSSWDIMQILSKVNARGTTVLVATHNKNIVDVMRKRVLLLAGGRIAQDQERSAYTMEEAPQQAAVQAGGELDV
jgi:cell division transport system ATP-binding protein